MNHHRAAFAAVVLTTATLVSSSAKAQDHAKKIGVGGDLIFALPLGDMADATGPAIGPVGRFGYRVIPPLELTGRIGYLFGFDKDQGLGFSSSISLLPIWAGARYFVMQPESGLHVGGELGLNILIFSESGDNGTINISSSDQRARLGVNGVVGYVISEDLPIDISAQFNLYNLLLKEDTTVTTPAGKVSSSENTIFGLGLSVGYTYQL
jgi:hypothetical protein